MIFVPAQQPEQESFYVDDLFMRRITCRISGFMIPQHSHLTDHWTYLRKGMVDLYIEDELVARQSAPKMIFIEAGKKHGFLTLTDLVVLQCIHDMEGTNIKEPPILEEHVLKVG